LIRDNNSNILKNYYSDQKKNYDVYSNFQEGNMQQQMPTIQIVNVQEAPKDNKKKNNKSNLKDNVDNLLEKSVNDFDFENPIRKQYNLKKNLETLLEQSTNEITSSDSLVNKPNIRTNKISNTRPITNINKKSITMPNTRPNTRPITNINKKSITRPITKPITRPKFKSSKNIPHKIKKQSRTKLDHFKDFMNDYTENIIVHDNFKKTRPVRSKKKCKNSNFISKFENKTKNHNIFK